MKKDSKIYIAGHRGLVGSAIWNNLTQKGYTNLVGRTSQELDLMDANMVERFFRDLTVNSIRRGVFRNVEEVTQAIYSHISAHNLNPKPFIWTAKANDILEKVKRGHQTLNNMQSA